MPRRLRIEYPGAMCHIVSRGDRQEKIFLDDADRQDFIKTLAEACQRTNWQVHAYCLPPSFGAYQAAPEHRPGWVRVDRLLGEHGIQQDTPEGRAQFEQWMERRRREETDPEALKALNNAFDQSNCDAGALWGAQRRPVRAFTAICTGAEPPVRARVNWGYEQRRRQEWPKG